MPRTRSLAWSELKIGIVTVAGVALLVMLIFMLGGQTGFFWQRYQLKARFPSAEGLKAGAVVRVSGVEVGQVTAVRFIGAEVEIDLEVRKEHRERITTESRATIGSLSLLGESAVDISASTMGEPIADEGVVPSAPPTPGVSQLTTSAAQGLERMNNLLGDMQEGRGTLGKLVRDDALYGELTTLVTSIQRVTEAVNKGQGTLGRLVNDPTAAKELQAALTNLNAVTRRLNEGEGSLGKLLNDPQLASSLTSMSKNLDDVTAKIQRGEGTAGKLINDSALYERLNAVTTRFETLMNNLNEGQGTAGLLLKDQKLYDNLNSAASELRNLIVQIQKDPKKYLNVRVSIF